MDIKGTIDEVYSREDLDHFDERILEGQAVYGVNYDDINTAIKVVFARRKEEIEHSELLESEPLSDNEKRFYRKKVEEESGTDALAFYLPFHVSRSKWGIYIYERSIRYLKELLFPTLKGKAADIAAYNVLFYHEQFHFLNEVAASFYEIAIPNPCHGTYIKYSHGYVSANKDKKRSWEPIEEALANRHSFIKNGKTNALYDFMETQPKGYTDFKLYISKNAFSLGKRKLISYYENYDSFTNHMASSPSELLLDTYLKEIKDSDVPVYLIDKKNMCYSLVSIFKFPVVNIVETPSFKKDLSNFSEDIVKQVRNKLKLLKHDIFHPGLRSHLIDGFKKERIWSISVNMDLRISLKVQGAVAELLRIGHHDVLYRNPL